MRSYLLITLLLGGTLTCMAADYKDGLKAWNEGQFEKALKVFRPLAHLGDPGAQVMVAHLYERGKGVTADKTQAAKWYRLAAEQGIAEAQFSLANLLWEGRGTLPDRQEAIRLFREAAEQGHTMAQYNLAVTLEATAGPAGCQEVERWLQASADVGFAAARSKLGRMFEIGKCMSPDLDKAIKYYRLAAEQGQVQAQCNLGALLRKGQAQNLAESVMWSTKAAEAGLAEAQFNLGLAFQTGAGVPRDYKQAAAWYRLAVAQGQAQAQCNLGFLYTHGLGVDADSREAQRLYMLAAAKGVEEARKALAEASHQVQGNADICLTCLPDLTQIALIALDPVL